uniref:Uncharacterized protein n=1 Tax=Arundo donax TaxID=35708 RepID=A0A0A9HKY4_ARUDO
MPSLDQNETMPRHQQHKVHILSRQNQPKRN